MKILHLENNAADAGLAREVITEEWPDCQITRVHSRFAYVGELHLSRHDLILADFALPSLSGLDALELARERAPGTPFILVSDPIGEDRAIEALCAGADDYVRKDQLKRLNPAIARVLRESEERKKRCRRAVRAHPPGRAPKASGDSGQETGDGSRAVRANRPRGAPHGEVGRRNRSFRPAGPPAHHSRSRRGASADWRCDCGRGFMPQRRT